MGLGPYGLAWAVGPEPHGPSWALLAMGPVRPPGPYGPWALWALVGHVGLVPSPTHMA